MRWVQVVVISTEYLYTKIIVQNSVDLHEFSRRNSLSIGVLFFGTQNMEDKASFILVNAPRTNAMVATLLSTVNALLLYIS